MHYKQLNITQGIDGSARKPALIQDTGYMVEKTYHDYSTIFGGFWGLFNASVMHIEMVFISHQAEVAFPLGCPNRPYQGRVGLGHGSLDVLGALW